MEHTLLFVPAQGGMQQAEEALLLRVSPERRAKIAALRRGEDRENALLAALCVRLFAVRARGVENGALHFARMADGKPYLADAPDFCFSFAHTQGAVALAVSPLAVGADIERLRPAPRGVAARFFTPAEEEFAAGSDARFFDVWTRREAFAKRAGTPLAETFDRAGQVPAQLAAQTRSFCTDGFVLAVASAAADAFSPRRLDADTLIRAALTELAPLGRAKG